MIWLQAVGLMSKQLFCGGQVRARLKDREIACVGLSLDFGMNYNVDCTYHFARFTFAGQEHSTTRFSFCSVIVGEGQIRLAEAA